MKDTISLDSIINRKVVLEVRYVGDYKIIDIRGKILKELFDANIIKDAKWEIGDGFVSITDVLETNTFLKKCTISNNSFLFISQLDQTNESFYNSFKKAFDVATRNLDLDIIRIGCRIQGTYKVNSKEYENILSNFIKEFPSTYLLKDYTPKDLLFRLVYENGQYEIGPINTNDKWTEKNFPNENQRKNDVGIAIDTDNYIIKSEQKGIIKPELVKDVYVASLSVEKLLFEKLKGL